MALRCESKIQKQRDGLRAALSSQVRPTMIKNHFADRSHLLAQQKVHPPKQRSRRRRSNVAKAERDRSATSQQGNAQSGHAARSLEELKTEFPARRGMLGYASGPRSLADRNPLLEPRAICSSRAVSLHLSLKLAIHALVL